MAEFDIHAVMGQLAHRRPIFHSEADFQFALAWRIKETLPDCEIRLEYKPFPTDRERMHLDVWAPTEGVAIELKYKTKTRSRGDPIEHDGEWFDLKEQSAQNHGRYDYIKDVQRLERVVADLKEASTGFAVLLTNDSGYWNRGRGRAIDDAFRLHEGRRLAGRMEWAKRASAGSIKGREEPLELRGSYDLRWHDYSKLTGAGADVWFRYLAIEVG